MRVIRETEYTKVVVMDERGQGNANYRYNIEPSTPPAKNEVSFCQAISFQKEPIKEAGVNGIQSEDLLAIVIDHLQGFQSGTFSCRETAIVLTKCQEALMWLDKRTADRKARGVEGKSIQ